MTHIVKRSARNVLVLLFVAVTSSPSRGDIDVNSDGSDGNLALGADFEFDLSTAASLCDCDGIDQGGDLDFIDDECRWDCPSPVAGQGVYDREQWAIVYKWTSVTIPAGVTVTFSTNHYSRAPVVWLVQGTVQIDGTLSVDGQSSNTGDSVIFPEPGPGGFRGGRATAGSTVFGSPGFGPGAHCTCAGGSYGTAGGGGSGTEYGNDAALPLIGGSGGGACGTSEGGGGGGAILVAANQSISVNGFVLARGGNGSGGSGGAIRLVADSVFGSGLLRAQGGSGSSAGVGRIRVEANDVQLVYPGVPLFVEDLPTFIFPPANSPKLRAITLGGVGVPSDPSGVIDDPTEADIGIATLDPVTLEIEAENFPVGTVVDVHIMPMFSATTSGICHTIVQSTPLADAGGGILTATADLTLPAGYSLVIMRAAFDPSTMAQQNRGLRRRPASNRIGSLQTPNGERVIRTELLAGPSGAGRTVYTTDKGRRISIAPAESGLPRTRIAGGYSESAPRAANR